MIFVFIRKEPERREGEDKYRFIFYIKKILIYNFLPGKRCITGSDLNNRDEQELQIHFDMVPDS